MTSVEEIKTLLLKNKKRLEKEFYESKEVVLLINKSIRTTLTSEEKKQVKEQLLDILKVIPAFAVFLLPGGALLLPLLVKLIPDILPSAFKKNIDKD